MDNYVKGSNVEESDGLDNFGIDSNGALKSDNLIVVNGRINNHSLFLSSLKLYKDHEILGVMGSGPNCKKVITLIEKVKRRYKKAVQYTNLDYKKVKEYWDPKIEDMDQLMVLREIPKISILLVTKPLENSPIIQQDSKSDFNKFCNINKTGNSGAGGASGTNNNNNNKKSGSINNNNNKTKNVKK